VIVVIDMSGLRNKSGKSSTSKKAIMSKSKHKGKTKIIQPVESIADKYYGAFKVEKWPEDIDGFIEEAMQKWWHHHATTT
jgi:hypothetical protein